jgi:hypothetical protein
MPNKTRVYAVIVEKSGLSVARAHWYIGSEYGVENLTEGWLGYYADIGPFNTTGTLTVYFYVEDTLGYPKQSDNVNVTVYPACTIQ